MTVALALAPRSDGRTPAPAASRTRSVRRHPGHQRNGRDFIAAGDSRPDEASANREVSRETINAGTRSAGSRRLNWPRVSRPWTARSRVAAARLAVGAQHQQTVCASPRIVSTGSVPRPARVLDVGRRQLTSVCYISAGPSREGGSETRRWRRRLKADEGMCKLERRPWPERNGRCVMRFNVARTHGAVRRGGSACWRRRLVRSPQSLRSPWARTDTRPTRWYVAVIGVLLAAEADFAVTTDNRETLLKVAV